MVALRSAARFFLVAPDRDDYTGLALNGADPPVPACAAFAQALFAAGSQSDAPWQAFVQAYEDIFYNTRGWGLSLWESSFRGEQGRLLDENTLQTIKFYESWGLAVRPGYPELPDHVGVQLSFAAFLLRLGDAFALQGLAAFLADHVGFLLAGMEEQVRAIREREPSHNAVLGVMESIESLVVSLRAELDNGLRHPLGQNRHCGEASRDDPLHGGLSCGEASLAISDEDFENALAPVADVFERLSPKARHGLASLPQQVFIAGLNNCGGRCGGTALRQNGTALSLKLDTKRSPCAAHCERGHAYLSTFLSPRRLRFPMKRIGERGEGRFKRISWEEAIETLSREWKRITRRYGPESRYINPGSGVCGITAPDAFAKRLAALDGGFLNSYNSYSSACAEVTTPYLYGTVFSGSSSHYLRESKLIILWGHNPAETFFGSYLIDELLRARARGTRIITIDPRYSETARILDAEWIALRPTTDAALADALAYVILSEGLEDREFVNGYCLGFDAEHMPDGVPAAENYGDYLLGAYDGRPKTPQWAAEITAVPAERIVELARAYAAAKPAALMPGLGMQRHSNGEQNVRGCIALACLTGNVGVAGGWAAGQGFVKGYPLLTVPRKENPYPAVIPSFLWTDAIVRGTGMTARDDGVRGAARLAAPIKLLFNLAGNLLINQHSDINRTIGILKDTSLCEFIVVSDVFMTPSARFADIVLPAPSFLETPNIPYPWREGDFLLYSDRAIEPLSECREEYQWLKELARSLGLYEEFTQRHENADQWLEYLYAQYAAAHIELPSYDAFVKRGGHYYQEPTRFIAFREQREDFENNPFPTPSGKIEICSERLYALGDERIPSTPRYVPGFEGPEDLRHAEYPFQLIGWHTKRRTHSTHDNNSWLERVERPFAHLNSTDAQRLGIGEGAEVELYNDRGCIRVTAHVSEEILPGVAALAQGAWYTPDAEGVDVRGNINVLTVATPTPLAKGNPQHSNLVGIRLC
jgi:anaerobic dimethyl sulfoxide reductase subunit A